MYPPPALRGLKTQMFQKYQMSSSYVLKLVYYSVSEQVSPSRRSQLKRSTSISGSARTPPLAKHRRTVQVTPLKTVITPLPQMSTEDDAAENEEALSSLFDDLGNMDAMSDISCDESWLPEDLQISSEDEEMVAESASESEELPGEPDTERRVFYKTCPDRKSYDTVNACKFCGKLIKQKMKRHLTSIHKNEAEVQEALKMTKKEGSEQFAKMKNEGNYKRNMHVLESGSGELLLTRRPKQSGIDVSKFRPCPGCFGFMLVSDLNKHSQRCVWLEGRGAQPHNVRVQSEVLMGRFEGEQVTPVLASMRQDMRSKVQADDTLMAYASYTTQCKGKSKNQEKVLKDRLSKLVNLLEGVRKRTDRAELTLKEICAPTHFDSIVEVTYEMGGYDVGTASRNPSFTIPSAPRVIGQALGKVAHVLQGQAIRDGDTALETQVNQFERLLKSEWGDRISRASLHTLNMRKQKKDDAIPSTENVQKLSAFLKSEVSAGSKALDPGNKIGLQERYNRLAERTMVSLLVFNKRRGGEASNIEVTDYTERANYEQNQTIMRSLSDLERELVAKMTLVQLIGKRGRVVPILIPPEERRAIEALLQARQIVGLPANGKLFAKTPRNTVMCHGYALKKTCREAGVDAQKITSTTLRKYLATVVQVMRLTENEMDQVAMHLGHDLNVHRRYYRLQHSTVELSKVSRLLLSTENHLEGGLDDE